MIARSGNTELHLTEAGEAREMAGNFLVDRAAACSETVREAGAAITAEIEDLPWEMREFEAADPDGNRINFGEHPNTIDGQGG